VAAQQADAPQKAVAKEPGVAVVPKPQPAAPKSETADPVVYRGRVLDPEGKAVAGAKLYLTGGEHASPECATTGPDGRFEFTAPKAKFGWYTVVAATAADHGAGWVKVSPGGKRDDLTLRLVADHVLITGQIVDLEGKPVPGATLTVLEIRAAPGEDLGPWLEAAKAKKGLTYDLEYKYLPRHTVALSPKVTTDAEGRFRLTGIGRNRIVRARLDGPTIASQEFCILTQPGKPIEVTHNKGDPEHGDPGTVTTYYGADFRHAAAPTRPIIGVVRGKDTMKPLPGVTVGSHTKAFSPNYFGTVYPIVRTTTDAEGRYRLTGMPKGEGYTIAAIPGSDQPYVAIHKCVPDTPGLDPVTVDIELKRGVWIEGQITDKVTGKPVKARVEYFALHSNPNLRDYPGFDGTSLIGDRAVGSKEDGSYRVAGLPGPGLVAVWPPKSHYLRVPDRDDEFRAEEGFLSVAPVSFTYKSAFCALARIDPAKGVDAVRRDITLEPAWTFTGTVLGPDGKPLAGARCCDLNRGYWVPWWEVEPMKTAEFTGGFNPHHPHDILFRYTEKGLIGVARPPKENGGSVTVRLEPGAAVTGRLVDSERKSRAGVELEVSFRQKGWESWLDYSAERVKTDREGRFGIAALLPGYEYRLADDTGELPFGSGLHSGQTQDLGDVQLKGKKE
jgi:protocatechuate 3,4-dioxygenase beta subunit